MAEVTERDKELTLSATSGEGLGSEVLDRIERAVAKGREEGRREERELTASKPIPEYLCSECHALLTEEEINA